MIIGALILIFGFVIGSVSGVFFMAAWYGGIKEGVTRGRSKRKHPVDAARELAEDVFGEENVDRGSFDQVKQETSH